MPSRTGADPPDEYIEAAVHRLLTENPQIAEQGIAVVRRDHSLVLSGEVESHRRRDEILRLVTTEFPDLPLLMDIGVIRAQEPTEVEELP
ncbi:BON domain-containing protein [Micromonospora sonneratiae]|uniref:BON domain-containing protein n=1 Tax=Micromonospora sonneratiae TaxID=1184706 RepID=A0ABW3YBU3_9ACTN